jgi:pimeloyl-ACP methyl ester carboxylesterase
LIKGFKANKKIIDFLGVFDLNTESVEYEVPIYYILGGNDWQTPYVIAQEYFSKINALYKKFYLVPNAGHMTMLDQADLAPRTHFFNALKVSPALFINFYCYVNLNI